MKKQFKGVVTTTNYGFELYGSNNIVNLTDELAYVCQKKMTIDIQIKSDIKTLLDEQKCKIYYHKNKYGVHCFNVNNIDIESILETYAGRFLYITIIADYKENDET